MFAFFHVLLLVIGLMVPTFTVTADVTFISAVASTAQHVQMHRKLAMDDSGEKLNVENLADVPVIKIYHLLCFHKGPFDQYNKIIHNTSPERCCNDLWTEGLLETKNKQYCLDHMALLPDIDSPAAMMGIMLDKLHFTWDNVKPVHYLAINDELDQDETRDIFPFKNNVQFRQIMVHKTKEERESIRDSSDHGVASYSPFHLVKYMPGGRDALKYYDAINGNDNIVSLLNGKVNGTLADDGGLHRAFRQKLALSVNRVNYIPTHSQAATYHMDVNATIFLPLMESVFIDADDPFIVDYNAGSSDPVLCRISILSSISTISMSKCNIQFISSETIDIEQPSFASRQYVVAFQINAAIEFSVSDFSDMLQEMYIGVDYGTTLHIRYQLPITSANHGVNGMVPILIQQPLLYSANIVITEKENGDILQYFVLDTRADLVQTTIPQPILVQVAAGNDTNYWWVTSITILSALVGGIIAMRSIDSISTWI